MQTTRDAHSKYLLDDIGAELLNGKGADIANELADDSITESVIVEVEDVLHDLMSRSCSQRPPLFDEGSITHIVAIRVLNKCQRIVCNFVHQLNALVI